MGRRLFSACETPATPRAHPPCSRTAEAAGAEERRGRPPRWPGSSSGRCRRPPRPRPWPPPPLAPSLAGQLAVRHACGRGSLRRRCCCRRNSAGSTRGAPAARARARAASCETPRPGRINRCAPAPAAPCAGRRVRRPPSSTRSTSPSSVRARRPGRCLLHGRRGRRLSCSNPRNRRRGRPRNGSPSVSVRSLRPVRKGTLKVLKTGPPSEREENGGRRFPRLSKKSGHATRAYSWLFSLALLDANEK
mmetsp:Transcript_2450/g.6178  ORF Transcript_2450/g.6178 Transcript_2450/m.6178 type:complete len:248 (-) Transcript_2450:199-942(-)